MHSTTLFRSGIFYGLLNILFIISVSPITISQNQIATTNTTVNTTGNGSRLYKEKYNASVLKEFHKWLSGKTPDHAHLFNRILSTHSDTNPTHMVVLHAGYGRSDYATHRIFWIQLILTIAYVFLSFIGLLSNLLVVYILVFMRRRALSSITNIFVLVLAISDIFLCGFNMPLQAYYEIKEQVRLTPVACKLIFACFGIPMHVSCLTILLIACDRYQIIIYPLRPRMSIQLALILVGLIVLLSILNSIPIAMFNIVSSAVIPPKTNWVAIDSYVYRFTHSHSYCVENWPNAETRLIYSVLAFLMHFLIPLMLTAALYGHIYCRLHERRFRKSSVERKRRTNKILIRIVICFALCWAPWTCFSLWLEVHAYMIQKKALELNNSFNRFETSLENLDLPESLEMRPTNWTELVNRSLNVDFDTVRSPTSSDEVSRTVLFRFYGVRSLGGSTKLIDLCLKLIAMASACINPWLYGWLRKLFHVFYQRSFKRLRKKLNLKTRMKNLAKKTNDIFKQSCICQRDLENIDEFINERTTDLPNSHDRQRKISRRATIHVCNCCGTLCTCQISLGILKRIDHLNYVSQIRSYQSCADNSSTASPSKDSCNPRDTCAPTDHAAKTKGGSRGSHSGSSRHKSSKNSNGAPTGGTTGVDKATEAIANGMKPGTISVDPFNSKYYVKGRRASSRLSGTSFGTMSYLDPSTKQTSLYPSSGVIPTPRSSFQHSTGLIPMYSDRPPYGSADTQKFGQGNLLSLPFTGLTPVMDMNRLGEHQDSNQFERSECFDDQGLTIDVPVLPNDYKKIELFNLHEQSEESNSETHANNSNVMPEFIQVSVHFPQTSKHSVPAQPQTISGIHLISCPQSMSSTIGSSKPDPHPSFTHCLQIEIPPNYSSQIPFADEADEQNDNPYDTCNSETSHSYSYANKTVSSTAIQPLIIEPKLKLNDCYISSDDIYNENNPMLLIPSMQTIGDRSTNQSDTPNMYDDQQYETGTDLTDASLHTSKQRASNDEGYLNLNAFKKFVPKNRYLSFRRRTIERDRHNPKDSLKRLEIKTGDRRVSHQESKLARKRSSSKQIDNPKPSVEQNQSFSDETSEIDEFAQIGRLVAIELMRKRQARDRTLSVCVPSTLPDQRHKQRLSTSNHGSDKKRLSFSILPGLHIPKLSDNRERSPRILEFDEQVLEFSHGHTNE